ncbi:MAG: PBP1A family penicillin-binding protein [Syntrophobacteraceae bacterium]
MDARLGFIPHLFPSSFLISHSAFGIMMQGPERLFRKRSSPWKFFFWVCLTIVSLSAGYFLYLYNEVHSRFESRRWSIPSRVFSATVPLYPGQSLSMFQLKFMLDERRYHEAVTEHLRPGEYKELGGRLVAHLREFQFPGHTLPSQRIEFNFEQNKLSKIRNAQGDVGFLELEPLEIARLFGPARESRLLVNMRQLPQYLIDAVTAIEDHRFYEHGGVDWWGIMRAVWTDVLAGRVLQGGSTITQQLVKNYFLEPQRNFKRKALEASMAVVIEACYGKDEIIEMYLNEIYLGQRGSVAIHGVGEAAGYYFGRNVEDLTLAEAATLAGMIRGPNNYNPLVNPEASRERRNTVLKRMVELGKISSEEFDRARIEPIRVAEYHLPVDVASYFVDYVRRQLQDLYATEALASEGLNIYTTLHPEMALAAESAVSKGLRDLEKEFPDLKRNAPDEPLQAALIAVQPKTGAVVALVGGREYAESNFNRALLANRQAGSAIKPFIYLAALDQFTPASWIADEQASYPVEDEEPWSPKNYDGSFRGRVTFRQALQDSLNIPTVNIALSVGLERVIATLRSFGIESPLSPVPSLALGAFEVTPIELIAAYAALDNDGQKPYLLGLKEVVAENGEIQERRTVDFDSVTTPAKAYIITELLQGGVEKGTARSVRQWGVDFPCAAKTGTTSDYRDSWFVGYTTDLVVLVWIGFDDNKATHLSGSQGAARIWSRFMNEIRPWIHPQPFRIPPGVVQRIICSESGLPASGICREKRLEIFLNENVPNEYCPLHLKN